MTKQTYDSVKLKFLENKRAAETHGPDYWKWMRGAVRTLAEAAENWMQMNEVCAFLVNDLKGEVGADLIRSSLTDKYKNVAMRDRTKAKQEIKPSSQILKGSKLSQKQKQAPQTTEETEEDVDKAKEELEADRKRLFDQHKPPVPELKIIPKSETTLQEENGDAIQNKIDRAHVALQAEENNNQEVILTGSAAERIAHILLRNRPYQEIFLRIRRGTNLVDMVESDEDRKQNKIKWLGVVR